MSLVQRALQSYALVQHCADLDACAMVATRAWPLGTPAAACSAGVGGQPQPGAPVLRPCAFRRCRAPEGSFPESVVYLKQHHAGISPFLATALALLSEVGKGAASPFSPYAATLPERCPDCLLSWTAEEKKELKGGPAGHASSSMMMGHGFWADWGRNGPAADDSRLPMRGSHPQTSATSCDTNTAVARLQPATMPPPANQLRHPAPPPHPHHPHHPFSLHTGTSLEDSGDMATDVYDRHVAPIVAARPDLWPPAACSREAFVRVTGLVQSRAFHLEAENWITGTTEVRERGEKGQRRWWGFGGVPLGQQQHMAVVQGGPPGGVRAWGPVWRVVWRHVQGGERQGGRLGPRVGSAPRRPVQASRAAPWLGRGVICV